MRTTLAGWVCFLLLVLFCSACEDSSASCKEMEAKGFCTSTAYAAYMEQTCPLTCGICDPELCQDFAEGCETKRANGYCNNPEYSISMRQDCRKTCGLCHKANECTTTADAAGQTCGDRIANAKTTLGLSQVEASNKVALEFPVQCGGCAVIVAAAGATCADSNQYCNSWTKSGYCTDPRYSAYMKVNCCVSCKSAPSPTPRPPTPRPPTPRPVSPTNRPVSPTNRPVTPTNRPVSPTTSRPTSRPPTTATSGGGCVSLTGRTTKTGVINIVIVGSAFTSTASFSTAAGALYNKFDEYIPLKKTITQLNVWRVDDFSQGSFCNFNCNGIARLLCCTSSKAQTLAGKCGASNTQVVVIHNDATYGGAGGAIATLSTNSAAALVGVHEIGHSLFKLEDEYNYNDVKMYPLKNINCATTATCEPWKSMIGWAGVNCVAKKCASSSGWASEETIMDKLNYKFQEVNLRKTCCIYKSKTGSYPQYCEQFKPANQGNLLTYCGTTAGFQVSQAVSLIQPCRKTFEAQSDGTWKEIDSEELEAGSFDWKELYGDANEDCSYDPSNRPICVPRDDGILVRTEGVDGRVDVSIFKPKDRIEYFHLEGDGTDAEGGYVDSDRKQISIVTECAVKVSAAAACATLKCDKDCPLQVDAQGCALCECREISTPDNYMTIGAASLSTPPLALVGLLAMAALKLIN